MIEYYGSVLKDCAAALKLNSKSPKAFYRAALALVALGREEEAIDGCDRCLTFDPCNSGIKVVRERASKALEARQVAEEKKKAQEQRERERKRELQGAFKVSIRWLYRVLIFFQATDRDYEGTKSNHDRQT